MKLLQNLKKYLPTALEMREHRHIHIFGDGLKQPELWAFNRNSSAKGIGIGIFCAFLPMPFEMIAAAFMAIALRGNLPFAVSLVWISNPVTWVPIYTPPYLLGAKILNLEPIALAKITVLEVGWHYVALWLGCLLVGAALGFASHFLITYFWRSNVRQRWAERTVTRAKRNAMQCQHPQEATRNTTVENFSAPRD